MDKIIDIEQESKNRNTKILYCKVTSVQNRTHKGKKHVIESKYGKVFKVDVNYDNR